jgi:hypothetical protein
MHFEKLLAHRVLCLASNAGMNSLTWDNCVDMLESISTYQLSYYRDDLVLIAFLMKCREYRQFISCRLVVTVSWREILVKVVTTLWNRKTTHFKWPKLSAELRMCGLGWDKKLIDALQNLEQCLWNRWQLRTYTWAVGACAGHPAILTPPLPQTVRRMQFSSSCE